MYEVHENGNVECWNQMSLCSVQKKGCQGLLVVEADSEWGGQKVGSTSESSITMKEPMHCRMWSSTKYPGARSSGCLILGGTRTSKPISPNIQGHEEESPDGRLATQLDLTGSTACRGKPTLWSPRANHLPYWWRLSCGPKWKLQRGRDKTWRLRLNRSRSERGVGLCLLLAPSIWQDNWEERGDPPDGLWLDQTTKGLQSKSKKKQKQKWKWNSLWSGYTSLWSIS